MRAHERTSAEALADQVPGKLLASSNRGRPWSDVLVQIFSRRQVQDAHIVPAVLEPMIVWVVSGSSIVEERELGGKWSATEVKPGDFFLTTSPTPYEMRWHATSEGPSETMHVYLGLPLIERAAREVLGAGKTIPRLSELSGKRDAAISAALEQLRCEVANSPKPSAMCLQGIAQVLAIYLMRNYRDEGAPALSTHGGLPAFKLQKATQLLESRLGEEFNLARLARAVALSEFHFSRLFKLSTGYAPSRYLIRLRMAKARRLLRETTRSVIEIGLEVGYGSPSHFGQIFRREVGTTPSKYRG